MSPNDALKLHSQWDKMEGCFHQWDTQILRYIYAKGFHSLMVISVQKLRIPSRGCYESSQSLRAQTRDTVEVYNVSTISYETNL